MGRHWSERWWLLPQEAGAIVSDLDGDWRVVLDHDSGTAWTFTAKGPGTEALVRWSYQTGEADWDGSSTLPSSIRSALSDLFEEMTAASPLHIDRQGQSVLDALVAEMHGDEWISGRRLRAALKQGREELQRAVAILSPRYVRSTDGSDGDQYSATLAGLLSSAHRDEVQRALVAALAEMRSQFERDPDFRVYSLDDVCTRGSFEASDRRFVRNVLQITRLQMGGGGSESEGRVVYDFGRPHDIEDLVKCGTAGQLLDYLRRGTSERAWPTAPPRLQHRLRAQGVAPSPSSARRTSASPHHYEIALSFAGEDRPVASALAAGLASAGVAVFYDEYEKSTLWGKNLYEYLHEVYATRARYCLMLISKAYLEKNWTIHERTAAQSRAFRESDREYILPVRLDQTPVPGLPETIGYLSMAQEGIQRIVDLTLQKLRAANAPVAHSPTPTAPPPRSERPDACRLILTVGHKKDSARSDGVRHTYWLLAKLLVPEGGNVLERFRLEVAWPNVAQLRHRTKGLDLESQDRRLNVLTTEFKRSVYPGQTVELLGPSTLCALEYEFDDTTLRLVERDLEFERAKPTLLTLKLYAQGYAPAVVTTNFTELNDF